MRTIAKVFKAFVGLAAGSFIFCSCNKNPEWFPLGPYDVRHYHNYTPIAGRVDDIGIAYNFDGQGGNAMFIACPGGGVWRSTDFTVATPNWKPLTDHIPGIADNLRMYINDVSSISIDYNNPKNIWASNIYAWVGLLHSQDGGASWKLAGVGQFAGNQYIYKVLIDPYGDIWVGCEHGFYVSEDKGVTFKRIDTGTFTNAAFNDIAWYSSRPGTFSVYTGVIDPSQSENKSGIWTIAASSGKFTWTQTPMTLRNIYGSAINSTLIHVIKLYADSKIGFVASASQAADFECNDPTGSIWGLLNVFQFDGITWQPKWKLSAGQVGNEVQAGYVQPLCITPDKKIYGGGKGIGVSDGAGGVMPVGAAQGALSNCQITGDNTIADKNGVVYHVDVHKLLYSYADDKIYMANDGGIVRFRLDINKPGRVDAWEPINTPSLQNFLTETVAFSSSSPTNLLAGHQDNGVLHGTGTGWEGVIVGESDFVFFDPFGTGYYMDCSGGCGSLGISTDGGKSFASSAVLPYDEHNPLLAIHPTVQNRMMIPCAKNKMLPEVYAVCETTDQWKTCHDLHLPNSGDHYYTTDAAGDRAPASGYTNEGVACYVSPIADENNIPFYRWFNPLNGDHFYTTDPAGELAASSGYSYEKIACYVFKKQLQNTIPLFRWYNAGNGDHYYTTNIAGGPAPANGYTAEGIACYVYDGLQAGAIPFFQWYSHIYSYPTALAYAGNTIYICADNRIYMSRDDGSTWVVAWISPATVISIATDINNPSAMYLVTNSDRVFYNDDMIAHSANFQDISGNLAAQNIKKIALFSQGAGKEPTLYLATNLGVFRTTQTQGNSTRWNKFGIGLPDTELKDLQVSQKTRWVYVATYGRGIWHVIDFLP